MTKEERAADAKERYEWYKAHGYCVRCRKEKAAPDHVMCMNCIDTRRIYDNSHNRSEIRKKRWIDNRDKEIARKRELNRHRKAQGICTDCGKAPAKCGVLCLPCYSRRKRRAQAARDAKGNTLLFRREHDLCLRCGLPLDNDKKLCESCCDQIRSFKTAWWQQLREEEPDRYAALISSMRPISGMKLYGKYAREGVTT
ncbi:MAG: hypothetical protein IKI59_06825 [Clostridia bacterium]|nr:hypothetical protein [Clostridia bacterium]